MKKRILIIVSNVAAIGPNNRRTGIFLPEVAHPYSEFIKANYEVDFASLNGDTPFLDALNLAEDPDNLKFLIGDGWSDMQHATILKEIDISVYDALFIPGGLAPMVDMPTHPELKKVIAEAYERGIIISAVCHGPVALLNVKLSDGSYIVNGKNITSFTSAEEDNYARKDVPFDLQRALSDQGAIFHASEPWSANCIIDGSIITGQNPASARSVGENVVMLLSQNQ
ncbi:type 1 glutamine amidotransferase domain-containing protein [Rhizosphaericola mali]|uniref:Type 1 glutamine amidotransferase domain-containing protein n=1 Tax=Rhizosphaericola mali TaxID=2545455 RepID=A0A5P2G6W0_9BACT|nr:type 1 glutamine amidotransferase domain-containing protein [Rhizosphaericola mali]QES89999.1 type 1 glutamine amidotransferase domain-containing protein [Rhizosphaericola mali]